MRKLRASRRLHYFYAKVVPKERNVSLRFSLPLSPALFLTRRLCATKKAATVVVAAVIYLRKLFRFNKSPIFCDMKFRILAGFFELDFIDHAAGAGFFVNVIDLGVR